MTQSQMLDLLMIRLGHRSSSQIRTAAALEAALAQETLEGRGWVPWFLQRDNYNDPGFVTVVGIENVVTPVGFLQMDEDAPFLYYLDTVADVWVELPGKPIAKLANVEVAKGAPKVYALFGDSFYLRPLPDIVYQLRLLAYFADTSFIDAPVANKWTTNAADWLLATTLGQVARKHIGDEAVAQSADADAAKAFDRIYRQHVGKQQIGRQGRMGE